MPPIAYLTLQRLRMQPEILELQLFCTKYSQGLGTPAMERFSTVGGRVSPASSFHSLGYSHSGSSMPDLTASDSRLATRPRWFQA